MPAWAWNWCSSTTSPASPTPNCSQPTPNPSGATAKILTSWNGPSKTGGRWSAATPTSRGGRPPVAPPTTSAAASPPASATASARRRPTDGRLDHHHPPRPLPGAHGRRLAVARAPPRCRRVLPRRQRPAGRRGGAPRRAPRAVGRREGHRDGRTVYGRRAHRRRSDGRVPGGVLMTTTPAFSGVIGAIAHLGEVLRGAARQFVEAMAAALEAERQAANDRVLADARRASLRRFESTDPAGRLAAMTARHR